MPRKVARDQTRTEEHLNALTHAIGAGLAVAGLILLVIAALPLGAEAVVGCAIFGSTLILLYVTSTLYHIVRHDSPWKSLLNHLDHGAIFLLIAGTYTPFMLVTVGHGWGWSIFGIQWGLATLGIASLFFRFERLRYVRVAAYLAMGWIVVIAVVPVTERMSGQGLACLFIGGLCYTVGVPFYLWKSRRYTHAIWHLFVLAGSTSHFFGALFHLAPVE